MSGTLNLFNPGGFLMKKTIWALSAMAMLGLFNLVACDEEETPSVNNCNEDKDCGENRYCVTAKTGKKVCSQYDACCDKKDDNSQCDREFDESGACVDKGGDIVNCTSDTQCKKGETCEKPEGSTQGQCKKASEAVKTFKYVRIDDASDGTKYTGEWDAAKKCAKTKDGICEEDPGADLDAIVLVKNGTPSYAAEIYDYKFGIAQAGIKFNKDDKNAPKLATNPLNVVGAPDSIDQYGKDEVTCKLYIDPEEKHCFGDGKDGVACTDRPYVSLGGPGGYIIVEMEQAIEANDKLDILEVGDCKTLNCDEDSADKCGSRKALADGVKVYVSMSDDTKEDWKVIADTAQAPQKGVISLEITSALLSAESKTLSD
jgi:hypothetical protein